MISLSVPLALLGLGILPVVWWLRRMGDPEAPSAVSAGFLFESSVPADGAQLIPSKWNPIWLMRIACLFLLITALAEPAWRAAEAHSITIWLDSSLSMRAIENEPRMAMASRVIKDAGKSTHREIEVRHLGSPTEVFSSNTGEMFSMLGKLTPGPAHIPLSLDPEREHWLITDGADTHLNRWSENLTRTIVVGDATQNMALTNLSARRSIQAEAHVDGLVRVDNTGASAKAGRSLTVWADGVEVIKRQLATPVQDSRWLNFTVPETTRVLSAQLSAGDALIEDDVLTLDLHALHPLQVKLESGCGNYLPRALGVNPGIKLQQQSLNADLVINCESLNVQSKDVTPTRARRLTILRDSNYQLVSGTLQHHKGLKLPIDPSLLRVGTSAPAISADTLWGAPAINAALLNSTPDGAVALLDLDAASLTGQSIYAPLINALAESTLNRDILDPIVSVTRSAEESRIQPLISSRSNPAPESGSGQLVDLVPALLAIALLLLTADLLITFSKGVRRLPA